MERRVVEEKLVEVAAELRRQAGYGFPGEELASTAYRRWTSFNRRNKSKRVTHEDKVRDLVRGLHAHFEPDIPYTHPNEWFWIAEELAKVFISLNMDEP